MKAIVVDADKNMQWQDVDDPVCGPDEVKIKIHATAINRADLMQRRGMYPPPPGASDVMGLECAGVVDAIGANVSRFSAGDRVCALLAGGGYAQYTIVHQGSVLPMPQGLSFEQAASLPEVYATAWINLFMEAGLQPAEKVILHAGASGVGTAGIQLCKAFGNPCFVTVGNADKLKACLDLGAGAGWNRHDGSFVESARLFAGQAGVDVILDPVGAGYLADNLDLLGPGGRLVLIGLMSGAQSEINLGMLMIKRARVIGSTLRARPVAEKAAVMKELYEKVWPKLEAGEIKPIIDTVMPITEANAAHDLVASDQTIGKVVMTVDV